MKRYVPSVALLILLTWFVSTVWLAIPALILMFQVLTDRPGQVLRTITGRNGSLRR